ncbi:ABC transporter permease [Actinomadura graeca]|uniref:ABC transporter permease n=1 Tax=Actinomadura graeca TaxID=2750812 RepID=A0ABX8QSE6_9ACTN|nr:ABC transporter permease [Actinomadura graeca]QXJ21662.1 ABC transporter permease [Actinomadura graeca]
MMPSLARAPGLARRRVERSLDETGLLCVTFLEGLRRTWDVRRWWGEFVGQCWFLVRVTGLPVMLIAVPLGATISLQVGDIARQLGAQSGTGALLVAAMVQQVAPLAAALLVSGVGGSAITSDMGARNIRDELAALEVMGINPVHRLVTPRLWAASTVSALLCPVVIMAGVLGGYYFNVIGQGVSPGAFFDGATALLRFPDLLITLFKAWVFGFIAAAVACHTGMTCGHGPVGVGRAVNRAVVVTSVVVFAVNYVLTMIYQVLVPPRS